MSENKDNNKTIGRVLMDIGAIFGLLELIDQLVRGKK